MDKPTFTFILLSLFTSREKALEIEGDLIEEAKIYGKLWKNFYIWHTTFALFRFSLLKAPVSSSIFAIISLIVLNRTNVLLQYELGPLLTGSPAYAFVLFDYSLCAITTFLAGVLLVKYNAKTGIRAVTLAAILALFWVTGTGLLKLYQYSQNIIVAGEKPTHILMTLLLCLLFGVIPLFAGGVHTYKCKLRKRS